jgi:hypothetical protein
MSNFLVFYEIAERASKVQSRKALGEFERFVYDTIKTYHDAAIEQVARVHLFRLKEQFSA